MSFFAAEEANSAPPNPSTEFEMPLCGRKIDGKGMEGRRKAKEGKGQNMEGMKEKHPPSPTHKINLWLRP